MTRIDHAITIDAPRHLVWTALADLDAVVRWNPQVIGAEVTPGPTGVGTVRTCQLARGGTLREVVSRWDEGHQIWFAIGPHGAVRSADMGFIVDGPPTAPTVTAVADYHLALGPLGPVIDRLTVRHLMTQMLATSLASLKHHVETELLPSAETPS